MRDSALRPRKFGSEKLYLLSLTALLIATSDVRFCFGLLIIFYICRIINRLYTSRQQKITTSGFYVNGNLDKMGISMGGGL